MVTFLILL